MHLTLYSCHANGALLSRYRLARRIAWLDLRDGRLQLRSARGEQQVVSEPVLQPAPPAPVWRLARVRMQSGDTSRANWLNMSGTS